MFGFLRTNDLPLLMEPSPEAARATPLPDDAFAALLAEAGRACGTRRRSIYGRAVWELAWSLDPWFVLVDERAPTVAGMPPPRRARIGPVRIVLAFSSEARATAAAHRLGLWTRETPLGVLAMPRDNACNWLGGLASADAVVWNPDGVRWLAFLRLSTLVAEYERRFDRLLPRMAGRFGEAVNRGGRPERARYIRRLFGLSEWWFVATEAKSTAPVLLASRSGVVTVPLYTDAERVRRGGPATVEPLREGAAVPIPTDPRRGFTYLRRLQERERPTTLALIINDVPGDVGEPAVLPIAELIEAGEALGW